MSEVQDQVKKIVGPFGTFFQDNYGNTLEDYTGEADSVVDLKRNKEDETERLITAVHGGETDLQTFRKGYQAQRPWVKILWNSIMQSFITNG